MVYKLKSISIDGEAGTPAGALAWSKHLVKNLARKLGVGDGQQIYLGTMSINGPVGACPEGPAWFRRILRDIAGQCFGSDNLDTFKFFGVYECSPKGKWHVHFMTQLSCLDAYKRVWDAVRNKHRILHEGAYIIPECKHIHLTKLGMPANRDLHLRLEKVAPDAVQNTIKYLIKSDGQKSKTLFGVDDFKKKKVYKPVRAQQN